MKPNNRKQYKNIGIVEDIVDVGKIRAKKKRTKENEEKRVQT